MPYGGLPGGLPGGFGMPLPVAAHPWGFAAAMASETRLTDMPNIHGLPNLPDFVEHRHDQSVLTILAKQQGVAIFRDPSQYWDMAPAPAWEEPFGQTVFLHRMRNQPLHKWLLKRLRRKYTGGHGFV